MDVIQSERVAVSKDGCLCTEVGNSWSLAAYSFATSKLWKVQGPPCIEFATKDQMQGVPLNFPFWFQFVGMCMETLSFFTVRW